MTPRSPALAFPWRCATGRHAHERRAAGRAEGAASAAASICRSAASSALLAKLGNPQHRLPPVIHVAGTNGKGSTAAYLKAMLQAAGKRVHVYTSPHLVRFHERIELAGADGKARPIGEAELVDLLARTSARQRRRRRDVLRDHDGGRLPGLRRAPGRRGDTGGGPRRPARCHQRRRPPGAVRDHARSRWTTRTSSATASR